MADKDYLVWAKMANYPHWPGLVRDLGDMDRETRIALGPPPKNQKLIYFFGSKNHGWVPDSSIRSDFEAEYEDHANHKKAKSQKTFTQGLKEVEKWKREHNARDEQDNNNKKELEEASVKNGKEDNKDEEKRHKEQDKKHKEEERKQKDEERKQKKKEDEKQKQVENDKKEHKKKDIDDKKKLSTESSKKHSLQRDPQKDAKKVSKEEEERARKRKPSDEDKDSTKKQKVSNAEDVGSSEIKKDSTELQNNENLGSEDPNSRTQKGSKKKLTSQQQSTMISSITRHPVSKYHNLTLNLGGEPGVATGKATFSAARLGSKQEVHMCVGATYYLIDAVSYAALAKILHEDETAITQDIHVSVLTPVPQGSEINLKAKVKHMKEPGLVYIDCEVFCMGKLAMTATSIRSFGEPFVMPKNENEQETSESPQKTT